MHHIGIVVDDLSRARRFYENAFGFEVVLEDRWRRGTVAIDESIGLTNSAARGLMLRGSNTYLELWEYSSPPAAEGQPSDRNANDLGLAHLAFQVNDFDAAMTAVLKAGGSLMGPLPMPVPDQPRAVYCRDPFGNILEVLQLPEEPPIHLGDLPAIGHEGLRAEPQTTMFLIEDGEVVGSRPKHEAGD
jgi:catechol 2,3-dioxygenase-like lactoylglutathione lyase family enzyme